MRLGSDGLIDSSDCVLGGAQDSALEPQVVEVGDGRGVLVLEKADHRLAQPGAGLQKKHRVAGVKAALDLIVTTIGAERITRGLTLPWIYYLPL